MVRIVALRPPDVLAPDRRAALYDMLEALQQNACARAHDESIAVLIPRAVGGGGVEVEGKLECEDVQVPAEAVEVAALWKGMSWEELGGEVEEASVEKAGSRDGKSEERRRRMWKGGGKRERKADMGGGSVAAAGGICAGAW